MERVENLPKFVKHRSHSILLNLLVMDGQLCGTRDRYKTLSTLLWTTLLSSMLFPSIGLAMDKEDYIKKNGRKFTAGYQQIVNLLKW